MNAENDSTEAASSPAGVFLSVVIPAFNEALRLPATLKQVVAYLASSKQSFEIIVVDDGSTDGTAEVLASSFGQQPRLRVIRNEFNSGKGFAVRQGMLQAQGDYILFTDADL